MLAYYTFESRAGLVKRKEVLPTEYELLWIHLPRIEDLAALQERLPFKVKLPRKLKAPSIHAAPDYSMFTVAVVRREKDHGYVLKHFSCITSSKVLVTFGEPLSEVEGIMKLHLEQPFTSIGEIVEQILLMLLGRCEEELDSVHNILDAVDELLAKQAASERLFKEVWVVKRRLRMLRRSISSMRYIAMHSYKLAEPIAKAVGNVKALLNYLSEEISHLEDRLDVIVGMLFTLSSDRLNRVVSKLTVISAIFLPLTLIASIYGMNFQYMPELKNPYAYPAVLAAMAVLAVSLVIYFRRKGYI